MLLAIVSMDSSIDCNRIAQPVFAVKSGDLSPVEGKSKEMARKYKIVGLKLSLLGKNAGQMVPGVLEFPLSNIASLEGS